MNYLAIDTCGKNLTLVLKVGEKTYTFFDKDLGLKHSVTLMPEIENLALKSGLNLKDLDFISCVVGAGSFTGIRIGVSTAKALCFSYKLKCLNLTSFDVLAYNDKDFKEKKVLALIDAGHKGYYAQKIDFGTFLEPEYILEDQVLALKDEYDIISADEITAFSVKKADLLSGLISATENKVSEATFDLETLVPLYVRKSQAEEGR